MKQCFFSFLDNLVYLNQSYKLLSSDVFYAANSQEVENAYWFGHGCLSIHLSICNTSFTKNHNCWDLDIS